MKTVLKLSVFAASLLLVPVCSPAAEAPAEGELTFPVLKIGTQTYSNVTVTTKAKDYVLIMHSTGLSSFKVKDMSDETLVAFGYKIPDRRTDTEKATSWAKETIAKVETPQVQEIQRKVEAKIGVPPQQIDYNKLTDVKFMGIILGSLLAVHLFFCYCLSLICRKAGHPGGFLVWIPVLQTFPMLRAANMSGWWFLMLFVPVLNLVPQIMWCFKISEARGKGILTAIMLLLPLTNILAFLYLAFSSEASSSIEEPPRRRSESLVLETA